jgi:hypothetical protein
VRLWHSCALHHHSPTSVVTFTLKKKEVWRRESKSGVSESESKIRAPRMRHRSPRLRQKRAFLRHGSPVCATDLVPIPYNKMGTSTETGGYSAQNCPLRQIFQSESLAQIDLFLAQSNPPTQVDIA